MPDSTFAPPVAFHLVPADEWAAASAREPFGAASLEREGFVHLTHRLDDLVDVANAFYRADPRPFVVLTVALDLAGSPWRYDGDERFPHVYGSIARAAITAVHPVQRAPDGRFLSMEDGPGRGRNV